MKGTKLASDIKYYTDYSKWKEDQQRVETWVDSVERIMSMHRENPKLEKAFQNKRFFELFELAEQEYLLKNIGGSQRALQFGGDPIMKHNAKMYNCLFSYCDRPDFFQEACYWLLCGCGVGFSVQKHHIAKLPPLCRRKDEVVPFVIPDSIEGWSDAFGNLIKSYFEGSERIIFDYSQIRLKGSYISGGFKAPGSEGLRKSLERCEQLLESQVKNTLIANIEPIIAYDLIMHISDTVLSGGVRRSSAICLFSMDDEKMMSAKSFQNFNPLSGLNPQRARSNNSVVLHRKETTKEQFLKVFEDIKQFGEPGFYLVDDYEQGTNPCCEIGLYAYTEDGRSGWQGCNLTTINGNKMTSKEKFYKACIASAVLGTIQATYTDLKYVSEESKEIFERESLLGNSVTGWMNNPQILLDKEVMREGSRLLRETNEELVAILRECGVNINIASRTATVKPEGNTSVLYETASGCHGEHSPMHFRVIQVNKESEIAKILIELFPEMIEDSIWSSTKSDIVVYIPVEPRSTSVFKDQLEGVKQLKVVKDIQENWVLPGTNQEVSVKPFLNHNVSNTVEVPEGQWEEVAEFLWEHKETFSGVSFLPKIGDKLYYQAPFTSVLSILEILEKYGDGSLFASGLIVDGLHVFDNLWDACDLVLKRDRRIEGTRQQTLLRLDWIRRAKQFAKRYFKNDLEKMTYCIKDVHLYHKWCTINRVLNIRELDFSKMGLKPDYIDADTMGAASCYGGACELPEYSLETANS